MNKIKSIITIALCVALLFSSLTTFAETTSNSNSQNGSDFELTADLKTIKNTNVRLEDKSSANSFSYVTLSPGQLLKSIDAKKGDDPIYCQVLYQGKLSNAYIPLANTVSAMHLVSINGKQELISEKDPNFVQNPSNYKIIKQAGTFNQFLDEKSESNVKTLLNNSNSYDYSDIDLDEEQDAEEIMNAEEASSEKGKTSNINNISNVKENKKSSVQSSSKPQQASATNVNILSDKKYQKQFKKVLKQVKERAKKSRHIVKVSLKEDTNLYSLNTELSEVKASLKEGNSVSVYCLGANWSCVTFNKNIGYIKTSAINLANLAGSDDFQLAYVATEKGKLTARTKSSKNAKKLYSMGSGEVVIKKSTLDSDKDLYNAAINFYGKNAFTLDKALSPIEVGSSEGQATIVFPGKEDRIAKINVRAAKSRKSTVVDKIYTFSFVDIISESDDWYLIETPHGKIGYIHKDFIKTIEKE